jgi:hypothetical protein
VYGEGEFALNKGWLYYVVIMNISVGYAFYCLGCFYIMLHGPLEAHNPVPKFLCIKAVLFLSFWQVGLDLPPYPPIPSPKAAMRRKMTLYPVVYAFSCP